jgi:Skp family chaperone for outer membrane proteins
MLLHKLTFPIAALCAVSLQAQEAPRFAFLHYEYVAQNTAQGRRVFADVEATRSRLQEQLRTRVEELQRLEQQASSPSLSEEGRGRIARQFEDGRIALQRLQEDSEAQFRTVSEAAAQQYNSELTPIVEALAKERNLHFVLQLADGLIAWADQTQLMEFTEEVARRYDAAFPSPAAAATTTRPTTTPAARPATSGNTGNRR